MENICAHQKLRRAIAAWEADLRARGDYLEDYIIRRGERMRAHPLSYPNTLDHFGFSRRDTEKLLEERDAIQNRRKNVVLQAVQQEESRGST